MLVLGVEKPEAASGRIFNCVSDRAVTLDGMAKYCANAAGLPLQILHYDPKAVGVDAKKAFPFRNMVLLYQTKTPSISQSQLLRQTIDLFVFAAFLRRACGSEGDSWMERDDQSTRGSQGEIQRVCQDW